MIEWLRNLVLRDFWLKLFSLALAVLFWLAVNLAINRERSPVATLSLRPPERMVFSNLPVVILSSAEDVRSVRVSPKEVEVTVQGDPAILKQLQGKDIRVIVDLTGIGAAMALRKRIEVSTPAGVTHVRVDPEEVQVLFPAKS
jgi:YbbR domain-containing protein